MALPKNCTIVAETNFNHLHCFYFQISMIVCVAISGSLLCVCITHQLGDPVNFFFGCNVLESFPGQFKVFFCAKFQMLVDSLTILSKKTFHLPTTFLETKKLIF